MPERPPISATGRIAKTHDAGRLYEVEMPNGYVAYAIVEKKGPPPPEGDMGGQTVGVEFSPFDMSKCRIVSWTPESE